MSAVFTSERHAAAVRAAWQGAWAVGRARPGRRARLRR